MNLVSALSQDSELLDWRRFLLSAAMPWPVPTQVQLLEVLTKFRAADPQGTGFVTEESYLQVHLLPHYMLFHWFCDYDEI